MEFDFFDEFVEMLRVGFDTPEKQIAYENNKISINKQVSKFWTEARENTKQKTCYLCGKPCTSFCNSHSIPQFTLNNITDDGLLAATLQEEIPTLGKSTGVKRAGRFKIICEECDNTIFQDYENPSAYTKVPTDKMLAQIALKNALHSISKRISEKELFRLLGENFPDAKDFTDEKQRIADFDLVEYRADFDYAKKALSSRASKYYLCYYKLLDYVVPYATQSEIAMICGFDDELINDTFNFDPSYKIHYINVVVFPLETKSVVMLFVKDGDKRYRKFYRTLKKLDDEDQLAVINYIVFAYTENVFLNQELANKLKKDKNFMDVCRQATDAISPLPFINPNYAAIKTFSLGNRHKIPNLLSKEYSLK